MGSFIRHYGILGMKWGKHKIVDRDSGKRAMNYQEESFVIKKGSELHRLSSTRNENHTGSGYASFLKEDSESYKKMGQVFSKIGMKQFDMTFKARKDLIGPSEKERVNVFLNKMKDPAFAKELRVQQSRMFIFNIPTPGDFKMSLRNRDVPFKKVLAYRALNAAISANKSLRAQYLAEFKKLHYDFILDETDANNKQGTAPIIFIERERGLDVVKVEDL